jgi:hypothetical protein
MFLRVNAKCATRCAHHSAHGWSNGAARNSEESRKTQLVFSAKAEVAGAVAPEYVRDPSSSDLRRQKSARIRTAPLLGAASAVPENSPAVDHIEAIGEIPRIRLHAETALRPPETSRSASKCRQPFLQSRRLNRFR